MLDIFSRRMLLLVLLMAAFVGRATAQGSDPAVVIISGSHYMAHVWDAANGGEWKLSPSTTFDPQTCIWYTTREYNPRDGYYNYYFIDNTGNSERRLFLSAHFQSSDLQLLEVATQAECEEATPSDKLCPNNMLMNRYNSEGRAFFWDWDFGLARGMQYQNYDASNCPADYNNTHPTECWECYWVVLDGIGWHMSEQSSYEAPSNYARHMRMDITQHAHNMIDPTGGIGQLANFSIEYNGTHSPTVTFSPFSSKYTVAYTTYTVKYPTNCEGDWFSRNCDTTRDFHNIWDDTDHGSATPDTVDDDITYDENAVTYQWTISGPGKPYLSFNSSEDELTSNSKTPTVYYRLHNYSGDKTATLTLEATYPNGLVQTRTATIIVVTECGNPPQDKAPVVTYDGVTISWLHTTTEGYHVYYRVKVEEGKPNVWSQVELSDVHSYTFTTLAHETTYEYCVGGVCSGAVDLEREGNVAPTHEFTTRPEPRIVIGGSVFGGGRMADVGGNTAVYIANCDTVSAVYGGNDIAGQVRGEDGSEVVIGVNDGQFPQNPYGTTNAPIHIGSVYGGGNGYYAYDGTSFAEATDSYSSHQVAENGVVRAMTDAHTVGDVVWTNGASATTLTIPTITKTAVKVSSDLVRLDSLFGGAKNAFVTVQNAANSSVVIDGGTIYSVFGGNNYGGTLGTGSTQSVTINGTTFTTQGNVQNTAESGFGKDYGIRYVFGGGNKVEGRNVVVNFTGGQVDTLFGGGNRADVGTVDITVDCQLTNNTSDWTVWDKTITKAIYDMYPSKDYSHVYSYTSRVGDESRSITYTQASYNYFKGRRYYWSGYTAKHKQYKNYVDSCVTDEELRAAYQAIHGDVVPPATNADSANLYQDSLDIYYGVSNLHNFDSIAVDYNYAWNGTGVYNIRTLFGGNNAADMRSSTPSITLTSGHVGTVYGGGNAGDMLHNATNAGLVDEQATPQQIPYGTHVEVNQYKMFVDYLYGGCQKSNVSYSTWVEVGEGHIGTIYGGCNISGDVGSNPSSGGDYRGGTWVKVRGGRVYGNVFAGSNGFYHCPGFVNYLEGIDYDDPEHYYLPTEDNDFTPTSVPTHNNTNVRISGDATIFGNVYAGGNLASVGFPSGYFNSTDIPEGDARRTFLPSTGFATVRMSGGRVAHNVYGGGNMASVYGHNEVIVSGGEIVGALYGGNDRAGSVGGMTSEDNPLNGTKASDGHTPLDNYVTYVLVTGAPTIGTVYGGGNGDYEYSENSDIPFCVAGGNYDALKPVQQGGSFVDINITGGATEVDGVKKSRGYIGTVYGGGDGVTVDGNIAVLLNTQNAPDEVDNVGNIFGGNNKGALAEVPQIILRQGQVANVYGGCNQGNMTGGGIALSFNIGGVDTTLEMVNSYVWLRNEYAAPDGGVLSCTNAVVSNAVYGGCRQANVQNNTLVYVDGGIHSNVRIFGGNDVSGEIGVSQVFINGGTVNEVYGGGNGNYVYAANGDIYDGTTIVGTVSSDDMNKHPKSGETLVKLTAGHCIGNVYAGGLAGDCGDTRLLVVGNNRFDGVLFGGGRGNVDNIGFACERVGEVYSTATVDLVSCDLASQGVKVYGGGHNGNVGQVDLILRETFHHPLKVIYGGCMASNVGEVNMTINGREGLNSGYNVDTLYGGNDFSGRVEKTVMNVNSGRFYTAYGAGNGDYVYKDYLTQVRVGDIVVTSTSRTDPPQLQSVEGTLGENEYADQSATLRPAGCVIDDYYIEWKWEDIEVNGEAKKRWIPNYHFWIDPAVCVYDTVPYSMEVQMNINAGGAEGKGPEFIFNVYGGGNMGLVGNRDMVANDMVAFIDPDDSDDSDDPTTYNRDRIRDMGLIEVNVHGGHFHRHIFTGASGRPGLKGHYFGSRDFTNSPYYNSETFNSLNPTNIDGGALGHQLVYGTKIFNMDGGHVEFSVYGGSESVDDGFPYECIGRKTPNLYTGHPHWAVLDFKSDHADAQRASYDNNGVLQDAPEGYVQYQPGDSNSTMRPSSIVNIVGGIVDKSVYGGGYQGNVYGSIFVNVGLHAVNDSPVWTSSFCAPPPLFTSDNDPDDPTSGYYDYYEGSDAVATVPDLDADGRPQYDGTTGELLTKKVTAPMIKYKPNLSNLTGIMNDNEHVTLTKSVANPIMLNASIYNASDWGEAGDKAYFNTRGVFGGVTNILIDGRDYNTGNPQDNGRLSVMNIANSVIGAGTSTEGGDINRLITIRHYGIYYECPEPTRTLSSIQRADKVILDSVFINLNGEQDAFSAFVSPNYALCRIDTMLMRRDNIVMLNAPGIYIGHWVSMRDTIEVTDFTLTQTPAATSWEASENLINNNYLYTNFMMQNTIANGGLDNHRNTFPNDFFDNLTNFYRVQDPSQAYNVDAHDCSVNQGSDDDPLYNHCSAMPQCSRLRRERGQANNMAAFNTLVLNNGSYLKISPYVDLLDERVKGSPKWFNENGAIMDGIDDNGHPWGHVHGWMYLVALDETQSYVYAANKALSPAANVTDGGFVSTCDCNNIWTGSIPGNQLRDAAGAVHDSWELNYTNINATATVLQPYRIWKIGQNRGTRKRHITLVANAKPDNILNYDVNPNTPVGETPAAPVYYNMQYAIVDDPSCTTNVENINQLVTTDGYDEENHTVTASSLPTSVNTGTEQAPVLSVPNRAALAHESYKIDYNTTKKHSQYSYAITTLELPPSSAGNFYVMTAPVIDLDNGGQLKLTDQAFVHKPDVDKPDVIFQAGDLYQETDDQQHSFVLEGDSLKVNSARSGMGEILNNPNYTFGLAFTTDYSGSNFNTTDDNWIATLAAAEGGLTTLQHINDSLSRYYTGRTIEKCHLDWPTSYISGNEFLSGAGGYVSKAVVGSDGTIPSMAFTLTYSRDISTTITRDITFTLEEYTSTGQYVGPVEVTVTINTVINDIDDLRADLLAMYNDGISNEYIRKITIPATFVQRDIYIEGIEWDINYAGYDPYSAGIEGEADKRMAKYMFNLADTSAGDDPAAHITDNRHFSLVINPSENMSERLTNHLGWYNIQTRNVDLFKMAYDDRVNNTSHYYSDNLNLAEADYNISLESFKAPSEARGASNKYNSANVIKSDGTETGQVSYMGSGGRSTGLLLGTLDGRSSAALDVRLLFNGNFVYGNYFPTPLGVVKLKMHWYNNKNTEEDRAQNVAEDGTFYIYIRLRTREEGDTIYMAWGDMMRNSQGKPAYFYKQGNTVHQVSYTPEGDPVLPAGVTRDMLYNDYYGFIQRTVEDDSGNSLGVATVHSYEWQQIHCTTEGKFTTLDDVSNRRNIKNNPDAYLRTFEQVMKIYEEGDVIDIMQTIPVGSISTKNAQAISGADFNVIQIIRYSGSHFKFPSMGCANRDALVDVTGNLTMRNVWFNGSGFTRVKGRASGKKVSEAIHYEEGWRPIPYSGHDATLNEIVSNNPENNYYQYSVTNGVYKDENGNNVSADADAHVTFYNEWPRERALLPVHAPMIFVHQGGSVNFSANVRLSNNINLGEPARKPRYEEWDNSTTPRTRNMKIYNYVTTTYNNSTEAEKEAAHIPGGAIAIIKDNDALTPELSMGTMGAVFDNMVVEPTYNSKNTDRTSELNTNVNRNSGAGVYVYGGRFYLGSSNYTATHTIEHNYYVKTSNHNPDPAPAPTSAPSYFERPTTIFSRDTVGSAAGGVRNTEDGSLVASTRITKGEIKQRMVTEVVWNDTKKEYEPTQVPKPYYTFALDTTGSHAQYFTLNNVQLTRIYNRNVTPPRPVRVDGFNDMILFRGKMSKASRVGVSKWFPGYIYNNSGQYHTNVYDALSTAHYHQLWDSIPRDTIGVARLTTGATIMAGYVYDSTVFFNDSVYYRTTTGSSSSPSFAMHSDEYLVNYGRDQAANPNFKDHVYMFHHDYLDPKIIYFQRCASFGKGVRQKLLTITDNSDPYNPKQFTINDYALGDSIAYRWNPDATCVASTDTILFNVGGGFFPYTFHWNMDSIVYEKNESLANYSGSDLGTGTSSHLALKRIPVKTRKTFGTNQIADLSSTMFDQLRARARVDTLVLSHLHMRQHLIKSTYMYECTAYDLTGRCPVSQPVMVRVGKLVSDASDVPGTQGIYVDSLNFLRHRNPYAAYMNYQDGTSAHQGYYEEKMSSSGTFVDAATVGTNVNPSLGSKFYKYSEGTDGVETESLGDDEVQSFRINGDPTSNSNPKIYDTVYDYNTSTVPPTPTIVGYRTMYLDDLGNVVYGETVANTSEADLPANRPAGYKDTWTRLYNYLYYRVPAAGVDSSSFHDRIVWTNRKTVFEDENRDVFFNTHGRKVTTTTTTGPVPSTADGETNIDIYTTTETIRSADFLVPYVRPLVIEKRDNKFYRINPTTEDLNYATYPMRDTLGFELRHFDSTVVTTVKVDRTTHFEVSRTVTGTLTAIHRHLWNKVKSDNVPKGIYTWKWEGTNFEEARNTLPTDLPYEYEGSDEIGSYTAIDRDTSDFVPLGYVPIHTHGGGYGSSKDAGIRRAGYSHVDMHWYNHGLNRGTLEQRVEARKFAGKPYHDAVMLDHNGLGDVRYVKESGSVDANNNPIWQDDDDMNSAGKGRLYASEMVPRYLRVYRSYKIEPHIRVAGTESDIIEKSVAQGGEGAAVWAFEDHETDFVEANKIDLNTAEFCPGGVVNLRPVHPNGTVDADVNHGVHSRSQYANGKWEYMAWSFDPSSQEVTNFVVNDDASKNSPIVYYAPGDYWHEVVRFYKDKGDFNYDLSRLAADAWAGQQYALTEDPVTHTLSYLDSSTVDADNRAAMRTWYQTAYNLGPTPTVTYTDDGGVQHTLQNDYYEDYYGDITIFSNKGLAWLVSKVNGFNNQAAQTYRFNTIRLDFDEVDMSAHKWLPLGNRQNNFEGLIKAQDSTLNAADELEPPVHVNPVVRHLIVNERNLPFAGMFGYTDHAKIRDFTISEASIRSNMYVGGLVGWADSSTTIRNMKIEKNDLFGEYVIGGIAARASESTIEKNHIASPSMYGNAIYAGQGVGRMSNTTIQNNRVVFDYDSDGEADPDPTGSTLSSVFYYHDPNTNFTAVNYGGLVGEVDNNGDDSGSTPAPSKRSKRGSKSAQQSVINNNYVQVNGSAANLNAGGLVGVANDVTMSNNYVYGVSGKASHVGGLVGVSGQNVNISNSYFVNGMTNSYLGQDNAGTPLQNTATFKGQGNQVHTSQPIDGVDNLTRILNKWVDQNGGGDTYLHWRSDFNSVNNGYPIFGTPDFIPVEDSAEVATCDSYDLDGLLLTESGRYVFHWVDSTEYVDSIFTLNLTITYGDTTAIADTVVLGQPYNGNGINLSAEQVEALFGTDRSLEVVTMRHVDSLLNANGCDSLVTLTLYIVNNDVSVPEVIETLSDVRLYPNPTLGTVYVEGFGLRSVEVYDNVSRTLLRLGEKELGDNSTKTSFDLSNYPAGAYYVRIRTSRGTVVKKVIKK